MLLLVFINENRIVCEEHLSTFNNQPRLRADCVALTRRPGGVDLGLITGKLYNG